MKKIVHGGDIYSFAQKNPGKAIIDFSANINPLGMPETVRQAAIEAVCDCVSYPDPWCRELRSAISKAENVPAEWIFCGNGAADILFRLALALYPRKALIPVPTFSEYEASLVGTNCELKLHFTQAKDGYAVTERILEDIDETVDIVYLCNPNNPTGDLTDPVLMRKILDRCSSVGAVLLADECFNDFVDDPERHTLRGMLRSYPNLVILRAFTKLYAMPGIRLGYCMTANEQLLERLYVCGQPWNVSVIAQKCGIAALLDGDFPKRTREMIAQQRGFLIQELKTLGFRVFNGHANYILFQNPGVPRLQQKLNEQGILIRSCANYQGLDDSYFRIAVRTESDNRLLIVAMKKAAEAR